MAGEAVDPQARQVGGNHYTSMRVQPWAAMRAWMSPEAFEGFLRGNAIKYLARAGSKGAKIEDIRKAAHYLEALEKHVAAGQVKARKQTLGGVDLWTCPDGLGGIATAPTEDECYRIVRNRNGEA